MSTVSFLEFQYKLSRNKFLRRPSRLFLSRDRQCSGSGSGSGLPMAFQLSMDELRVVFNKFDSNRDGKISQQEYKATLRALGQDHAISDVPKIFKVVDLDGDGFIDFDEFVEAQKNGVGVRILDVQNAFSMFDANGDGKISPEEVMQVLIRLGERCSLEDCKRMVRAVDLDGDGMVNIDEFTSMMTQSLMRIN